MQGRSLGWEDALEEGTATHSRILAWRAPWTAEAGGLRSTGYHRVRHDCSVREENSRGIRHHGSDATHTWWDKCTRGWS